MHLHVSTSQGPELLLDLSGQKEPVLTLDLCRAQGPELLPEVSGKQEPVLDWTCLHHRRLSCTWMRLQYRGLCCTWKCLYNKSLEVCPLGDIQNSVHGNNQWNYIKFFKLMQHGIPWNSAEFRRFPTEYGSYRSTKYIRNSVLIEFRGLEPQTRITRAKAIYPKYPPFSKEKMQWNICSILHWYWIFSIAAHRHSGILYLSPVPEHSGTGLVQASAFLCIPVPDWVDAGQSDIPAFKKGVHPARPYSWRWKGTCLAHPNCWTRLVFKFFKGSDDLLFKKCIYSV